MKRFFTLSLLVIILSIPSVSHAGKMDLMLKMAMDKPTVGKAMLGKSLSMIDGVQRVDILIKSSDVDMTRVAIEDAGGRVGSVIGDIMTASVPMDFLSKMEKLDEVEKVEASEALRPLMDSARQNTGVSTLQSGYGGTTYDGTNVIVGVIDTGIDYKNDDFKDSSGNSRVQYMRFQTAKSDSMSVVECAHDKIIDDDCSQIPTTNDSLSSHGTHVTGSAAGSDSTYTGMAPNADIMFVRNSYYDDTTESGDSTFSAGVLDGVMEIFKKADILDKPAVINISQGTHIGAHDDTSLLEQGIDNAVNGEYVSGGKSYGRAVVAAAGNENIVADVLGIASSLAGGIHVGFNVPSGSSYARRLWVLQISTTSGVYAPGRTPLIIDAWFGSGESDNCKLAANVYPFSDAMGGSTTTSDAVLGTGDIALSSDNVSNSIQSSDKKVGIITSSDSSDSQNNKPRMLIAYGPGDSGSWSDIQTDASSTGYVLDVIVRANGGACDGNMWIEGGGTYVNFMKGLDTGSYDVGDGGNGDGYKIKNGDSNMTVDIPATASKVIAVGAYLQEKPYGSGTSKWTDSNGVTYDATDIDEDSDAYVNGGTVGSRCPFSSLGPTADGRTKPDILAPGDPVISTMASGYSLASDSPLKVDSNHFKLQGTSQASPQVAGFVALLFQKNNKLTADEVKTAITGTAASAMVVGKADNSNGYGKLDAVSSIDSISADTSGYSGTGDLKTSDLDNSNSSSSSGGCGGMISPSSRMSLPNPVGVIFLMLPAIIIVFRRKRAR